MESGVQALIDRLFRDGVDAAEAQAADMLAAARAEAEAILDRARSEAEVLLAAAAAEAEQRRRAGEAAIRLAVRDALLRVREQLADQFERRLAEHVDAAMADPAVMADLVRQAAAALVGDQPLQARLGISPDCAGAVMARLGNDLLAREIRIEAAPGGPALVARRAGQGIGIELDRDTVAAFLMAELRPQMRGLLDGVTELS